MRKFTLLLVLWAAMIIPLWPEIWSESRTLAWDEDPASFIGYTLSELIQRFGVPRSVYPVRGLQEWDDDVVFVYDEGDFYIIKDRVWQIGLSSAYLIQAGDSRAAVHLSFGQSLLSGEDFAIFPLGGHNWPLAMRFNFDSTGRVTVIFIYRSDI